MKEVEARRVTLVNLFYLIGWVQLLHPLYVVIDLEENGKGMEVKNVAFLHILKECVLHPLIVPIQ